MIRKCSYGKLQEYARDLNTSIAAPEIVFIGRQGIYDLFLFCWKKMKIEKKIFLFTKGDGKTALIDAVVGERINPAGDTKRPLHLTLVNNAECTTVKTLNHSIFFFFLTLVSWLNSRELLSNVIQPFLNMIMIHLPLCNLLRGLNWCCFLSSIYIYISCWNSEIDDRNRDFTDVPIYVLYESAS